MKKIILGAALLLGATFAGNAKTNNHVKAKSNYRALYPIAIQLSCGTLTADYTCPGCSMTDVMHDMDILKAYGEGYCAGAAAAVV